MKTSNQRKFEKQLEKLKKKYKPKLTFKGKKSKRGKGKKKEDSGKRTEKARAKSKLTEKNKSFLSSNRKLNLKVFKNNIMGMKKNIDKKVGRIGQTNSCRKIPLMLHFSKSMKKPKNGKKNLKKKNTANLKQINEDADERGLLDKNFYGSQKQVLTTFFPSKANPQRQYLTSKNFKRPGQGHDEKRERTLRNGKKKARKKKSKIPHARKSKICSKSSRLIRANSQIKENQILNKQKSIMLDKVDSVSSKELEYDEELERFHLKRRNERKFLNILKRKVEGSEGLDTVRRSIHDTFKDTSSNSWILIFQTSLEFYSIEKEIGKGSFGNVFKATQILTNTQVALKKICKNTIRVKGVEEKIQREIKILKNLNDHPNVVRLIEEFEDADFYYLVFEYLPEGDLVTFFRKNDLFCEKKLKKFFYQILEGLQHIHLKGVIHRDIKPENILLDSRLSPKIADFGISTIFRKKNPICDTGGTPIYLAPEVIQAEGKVGFNTDVWSCGVLLYLLAVGDVPFKADEVQILYGKILNDPFDISLKIESEEVSSELGHLLSNMLIKDPLDRFSLVDCMKHPWFRPHNKYFGKDGRRRSHNNRSKSQNCSMNQSNFFTKNSMSLFKSNVQEGVAFPKLAMQSRGFPAEFNSCKNISFLSGGLSQLKPKFAMQNSWNIFERETIQKKSKTVKKKVPNFDRILNSSTELINTNSRNCKSQRKIHRLKLSESEVWECKMSVVMRFLVDSGFPQKYIHDTVFEKDKQFTHIKSCFDQLIEFL